MAGINSFGVATGTAFRNGSTNSVGVLFDGQAVIILQPPGAVSTIARGINDHGTVVGDYFDKEGNRHGFIYENTKFVSYGLEHSSNTKLSVILNNGLIAGTYVDEFKGVVPFYNARGFGSQVIRAFLPAGATDADLTGVGPNNELVGTYYDSANQPHGFIVQPGNPATITAIAPFQSTFNIIDGVNSTGSIVGSALKPGGAWEGFLGVCPAGMAPCVN